MKYLTILLTLAIPMFSQELSKSYKVSVASLAIATSADIGTSWGLYETREFVGQGKFGPRQAMVSSAYAGAFLGVQYFIVRKWPKSQKVFKYVNFAGAGIEGMQAWKNGRLR
jgi:hypothetical protein